MSNVPLSDVETTQYLSRLEELLKQYEEKIPMLEKLYWEIYYIRNEIDVISKKLGIKTNIDENSGQ